MAHSYKNKKVDFTSTNQVDLLAPAEKKTMIIKSMIISDDGGGSGYAIVITNGSDTFNFIPTGNVGANAVAELLTNPFVLEYGDTLKMTATTANRLHIVISYLEVS